MADIITECLGCYNLIFENCGEEILLPTGLDPDTALAWQITDKFGNLYRGEGIVGADGNIVINTTTAAGFPDGLFTPHSGTFTWEAFDMDHTDILCEALTLTICEEEYVCVDFSFANITYL